MTSPEDQRRLKEVSRQAEQDGVTPSLFIQREIRGAIQRGNPFIDPDDSFVVLGFDGFDNTIFPTGSFKDVAEALKHAQEKRGEEWKFSSDPEIPGIGNISTRFQTYTMDGILVNPPDLEIKP